MLILKAAVLLLGAMVNAATLSRTKTTVSRRLIRRSTAKFSFNRTARHERHQGGVHVKHAGRVRHERHHASAIVSSDGIIQQKRKKLDIGARMLKVADRKRNETFVPVPMTVDGIIPSMLAATKKSSVDVHFSQAWSRLTPLWFPYVASFGLPHSSPSSSRNSHVVGSALVLQKLGNDSALSKWVVAFFITLAFAICVVQRILCGLPVPLPTDAALCSLRGRRCWLYILSCVTLFMSCVAFVFTLTSIADTNHAMLKQNPPLGKSSAWQNVEGTMIDIKYYRINHPGERAYEAGLGIMLSGVVACAVLLLLRHRRLAKISVRLLAQFAVRGGGMLLLIALPTKIIVEAFFMMATLEFNWQGKSDSAWSVLGIGVIPALCIEFAKYVAITSGAFLLASTARSRSTEGLCNRCCSVLVESPTGLALAGLSVGFGMMIVENSMFMVDLAIVPPMKVKDFRTGEAEVTSEGMLRITRCALILSRVLLNQHPWLAGITAARVARVSFPQKQGMVSLSLAEMTWAIAPALIIEIIFLTILMFVSGLFTSGVMLIFAFITSKVFWTEWTRLEKPAATPTPTAPAPNEGGAEGMSQSDRSTSSIAVLQAELRRQSEAAESEYVAEAESPVHRSKPSREPTKGRFTERVDELQAELRRQKEAASNELGADLAMPTTGSPTDNAQWPPRSPR